MRCPVCGAKIRDVACRYCKTTKKEILTASNKKALALRKEDHKKAEDVVVYSSEIPSDVNATKLKILTGTLGWFGANDFYVGRYARAIFKLVVSVPFLILVFLRTLGEMFSWYNIDNIDLVCKVLAIPAAIAFFMYVTDFVGVFFHRYKIPVVLGDKDE